MPWISSNGAVMRIGRGRRSVGALPLPYLPTGRGDSSRRSILRTNHYAAFRLEDTEIGVVGRVGGFHLPTSSSQVVCLKNLTALGDLGAGVFPVVSVFHAGMRPPGVILALQFLQSVFASSFPRRCPGHVVGLGDLC